MTTRGTQLRRCCTAALAGLLAACAATNPGSPTVSTSASASDASAWPPWKHERPVDVSVGLRAPLRARLTGDVVGPGGPSLAVVVTNRSARPVDVADLRVHLRAAREGTSLRCAEEAGALPGAREPATLAPGASFVFERTLDCALPLVGSYAVRVAVSFGKSDWRVPQEVRAFGLTVTALPNVEPRELEGIPGLWAAIGASGMLSGGGGREHGRTLLAIVNATAKPIEVPGMRLLLRTYRAGNPTPCEDAPVALATPAILGSAETYYEPVEVSCLGLSVPGTYDVAAWLVVARGSEGDREIALGRLRVDVVTDPSMVGPRPWR